MSGLLTCAWESLLCSGLSTLRTSKGACGRVGGAECYWRLKYPCHVRVSDQGYHQVRVRRVMPQAELHVPRRGQHVKQGKL